MVVGEEVSSSIALKRKARSPSPAAPAAAEHQKVVWPPVVVIENTLTHFDDEKRVWKGLENEEIRSFLKGIKDLHYGRVMALYGPRGNKGKSIVIFPTSPLGFMDAQALCECLERDRRGRSHWLDDRSSRQLLTTKDGKRILYGYLASERDMLDIDPHRKVVKRWTVESYAEKVLLPLKRIEVDKEEAKKRRLELLEEKNRKLLAVEKNKSEFGKATAEFKKMEEEVQHHKRQEEEQEAKHRRDFAERKWSYEKEKSTKLEEFRSREQEIREKLNQNKIAKELAIAQYDEAARHLKHGIDVENKKFEVRIAEQMQIEAMELMKVDLKLQAQMEERLTLLEKKFQDKQLQLQEQHNKQIRESKEAIATDREKLLEDKMKELEVIDKEVKDAKNTSQLVQEELHECAICMEEFGKEAKGRAHFQACGHANVCLSCAANIWELARSKKKMPLCPTCKTEQQQEWIDLPARIYM